VADVQFFEKGEGRDRLYVAVIQSVACVHPKTEFVSIAGRGFQALEFGFPVRPPTIGVAAGVQFDEVGTGLGRDFDGLGDGVEEETDQNADALEAWDLFTQALDPALGIQTAFGRQLLALLGYQTNFIRLQLASDTDHFLVERHLHVQGTLDRFTQQAQVAVLDVAPVLAEVDRDSVGTGEFAEDCRGDRIGTGATAGLPDGSNVIDVDMEPGHGGAYSRAVLRITAGEHRGRKLRVPAVRATRPLVERARQAVMDHLRDLIPGALVWDVYAGSGVLGFEALSRGAARVVAVERHPRALRQLRENATSLGYLERFDFVRVDARHFLDRNPPAPDLIFYDPPYAAFRGPGRAGVWSLFCRLAGELRPGGAAVVHTPCGILTSGERDRLPGLERRDYGSSSLYWWHAPRDEA